MEQHSYYPESTGAEDGETMSICANAEEIEELAMGMLTGARAATARDHLAVCEPCREEHELLLAERALFTSRAAIVRPTPDVEARVLAGARREIDAHGARQASLASATRVVFALVACVSALVGTGWLDRNMPSIERAPYASESATASSSLDEPLACAFPVSGFVHASDRAIACAVSDGLAPTVADRGMCEDRVTSSVATP